MRAIISVIGLLSMSAAAFILMAEFVSLKAGCGAGLLVIGFGLYLDSITINNSTGAK